MVPHGDRSGAVLEPWLTEQWYVDAKTLAEPALAAVREGKTKFIPENWEKTYFQWLENIQPWCISRQLWWGHQIPAWYGPSMRDDESIRPLAISGGQAVFIEGSPCLFVAATEKDAQSQAEKFYGKPCRHRQRWVGGIRHPT